LADPEVKEKLFRLGIEPVGGTPADFSTMLGRESTKWRKIIVDRKITAE
jgi:tripartite-type tricarboxylate transporter receptor subunit TctC